MTLLRGLLQKFVALVRPTESDDDEEMFDREPIFDWTATATSPIRPFQVRMARAALGWGVRDLAGKAHLTAGTITRFENGYDAKPATVDAIRSALESAGVEFITERGRGVGVMLRAEGNTVAVSNPNTV